MSISGMTDNVSNTGIFTFDLRRSAETLPERYPRARWPTANDSFSPFSQPRVKSGSNKAYRSNHYASNH
jgi:hypothetical protein